MLQQRNESQATSLSTADSLVHAGLPSLFESADTTSAKKRKRKAPQAKVTLQQLADCHECLTVDIELDGQPSSLEILRPLIASSPLYLLYEANNLDKMLKLLMTSGELTDQKNSYQIGAP